MGASLGFGFFYIEDSFPKPKKEQPFEIKLTDVVSQNFSEKKKKKDLPV